MHSNIVKGLSITSVDMVFGLPGQNGCNVLQHNLLGTRAELPRAFTGDASLKHSTRVEEVRKNAKHVVLDHRQSNFPLRAGTQ
eukprot:1305275-Amphidinium_carterae.1